MLAVAAAFFCCGRQAADFERIEIGNGEVSIEAVDGNRRSLRTLPSSRVRVEVQRHRGDVAVWLASGAERFPVGRHLRAARREQLAEELKGALRPALPA
jgi:uncharacterized membrane protein